MSSHLLHANIYAVGFVPRKTFRFSVTVVEIDVTFWANLREIGVWKVSLKLQVVRVVSVRKAKCELRVSKFQLACIMRL